MPQRRLSRDSIELSQLPTRPSSLADDLHVSFNSQSQGLLETPTGYNGPNVDEAGVICLHETPLSPHSLSPEPSSHQRQHFWLRIGVKGVLAISLGSLLLIGSVIFLCFLWFEALEAQKPEGGKPLKIWQYIVFAEWITRAVIITAAVMRSAITAQAAVIAAMIAAIIIESTGVQLSQLPILSITRAVNPFVLSLAMPAYTQIRGSPRSFYLPLVIITTSCVLTLGSQFISTILLSDFEVANISNVLWRFAEYRERTKYQMTHPHIADTGRTLRAFLPLVDEKTRTNLRSYAGETQFDQSYSWEYNSTATYIIAEDKSIPTTRTGLLIVIAMVTAHLAVLGTTVFLFLRRTEATMLGNAWQSVAQVVSDDTLPILDQAGDLRDKEVKKALAESGEGTQRAGVIRRRKNGRVQFGERDEE
ncbi:hypothetical protein PG994_003910 [Apiospora phragmitis]|uniref:Uncharacterized protein n=1 Tax=Apiospora phragmitis TaxID=2905665 RepID=A0ABR1W3B7_9PEZI